MSFVFEQPELKKETRAMQALLSCPTNSIGHTGPRVEMRKVARSFPIPIESEVFHNGYHAENSFGAASYLIHRKNGNIFIDSPRYSSVITKNVEDMGGLKFQYLTHRDDISDTDLYQKDFNSQRIMHSGDISEKTEHFEIKLDSQEDYRIDEDIIIIPVPGHTKGHSVLLYKEKYLFTGDHLSFSLESKKLIAFKDHCWFDFKIQIQSMEKLLNYNFSYILPAHGSPFKAQSSSEMRLELVKCIEWMKR